MLQQGDINQFQGMARELLDYNEKSGQPSGWTGSMFSGMPSYHITGYQTSVNFISYIHDAIYSDTAGPVFFFLITAYILFLVLGAPWWLAALGAIATAFSSYNIIIIVAGHITKIWALTYSPLVLAGMISLFKKKYWQGFVLFTVGLSLLILANHLQITYYLALFCLILFGGLIRWLKNDWKAFGIVSGLLTAGVLLAVLANLSNLYINYESGQESMRGRSELTPLNQADEQKTAADGLDKDYVFSWSYGKAETLSLMIPNVMGGESGGTLSRDSNLYQELKDHGAQTSRDGVQSYTYWGEKPFTSGPVYLGAIVCFLFILGLFIVPDKIKWWLLGATVFFIFLAWGKNFAWFNDWMYYHFPLYSKFRTVEMALVIPAFTVPILAVLALNTLCNQGIAGQARNDGALYWSAGITAGICLILWIMPSAFLNFESTFDAQFQSQAPDWYYTALVADRQALLQADALRSLIFIALAAGLIWIFIRSNDTKKTLPYIATGLIILILADLWTVDKRYLNEKNFLTKKAHKEQSFPKMPVDEFILRDQSPSYRVLNLQNPFNESRTAYFHKSIGGYHAAKLGRYQDLIDRRLSKEIAAIAAALQTAVHPEDLFPVFQNSPALNMLNTRYLIYHTEQPPLVNPFAFGNAWFVDQYGFVDTPDDEMAALDHLNPKTEAVFDKQFQPEIEKTVIVPDSTATIEMTAYYPNRVEYESSSSQAGLAVFSEVYYKNGWKAFVDGQAVPISRADWILRAVEIPAGKHHIEMIFDPDNVRICGIISAIFSGLVVLLLLVSGVRFFTPKSPKGDSAVA
ncbi:membrane protein [Bacteroidia bacterium]|nr:membrane protein [Bacteroidia bacterium]